MLKNNKTIIKLTRSKSYSSITVLKLENSTRGIISKSHCRPEILHRKLTYFITIFFKGKIKKISVILFKNLSFISSDESEVSLNKDDDNGSDFAPWKASESPEPGGVDSTDFPASKEGENKAELLKSTLKANIGKTSSDRRVFLSGP